MTETRLLSHRVLSTGTSRHPEFSVHRGTGPQAISFSITVLLLETTTGYWLFDTGVSLHLERLKAGIWSRAYERVVPFEIDSLGSAVQQLGALGIPPNELSQIIISHFHADHVGGLLDFPQAAVVGSSDGLREIRRMKGLRAARHALFDVLLPSDLESRFSSVRSRPSFKLPWPGWESAPAWRLSDDDSIIAVSLPGHSAGQIGLLLNGPAGSFHIADAAWTTSAIVNHRQPSRITRLVQDDWRQYLDTLERLHRLHQSQGPELIPCHCTASMGNSV